MKVENHYISVRLSTFFLSFLNLKMVLIAEEVFNPIRKRAEEGEAKKTNKWTRPSKDHSTTDSSEKM